jgi:hypothetical protein
MKVHVIEKRIHRDGVGVIPNHEYAELQNEDMNG